MAWQPITRTIDDPSHRGIETPTGLTGFCKYDTFLGLQFILSPQDALGSDTLTATVENTTNRGIIERQMSY